MRFISCLGFYKWCPEANYSFKSEGSTDEGIDPLFPAMSDLPQIVRLTLVEVYSARGGRTSFET